MGALGKAVAGELGGAGSHIGELAERVRPRTTGDVLRDVPACTECFADGIAQAQHHEGFARNRSAAMVRAFVKPEKRTATSRLHHGFR